MSEDRRALLCTLLFFAVSAVLARGSYGASVEDEVTSFVKQIYSDNDIRISFSQLPPHARGDVRVKTVSFRKVPDASGEGVCIVVIEGKTGAQIDVQVPFKVLVKKKLYVAKHEITKGEVIQLNDLEVKESYLNGAGGVYPASPEEILGKLAKKEISAGETVTRQLLDDALAVQKGELVTMIAESRSLVVEGKGIALDKARIGDLVRIKSSSGKEVIGKVTGNETVAVEF